MTTKQARRLLLHTVVVRDKNLDDCGIVTSHGWERFFVNWENGPGEWVFYDDAEQIEVY